MMITLVVDYSGWPVKAFESRTDATREAGVLNGALSPWERAAGYFYRLSDEINVVKKQNDLDNRK